MTVHTCPRCPLRFSTRAEVSDHMAHDHRVPAEALQALAYPGAAEAQPLYRQFAADDGVHRVLLVANQTLGSEAVTAEMGRRRRIHPSLAVMVVVPATPSEHLVDHDGPRRPGRVATLDARTDDMGIAQARYRLRRAVGMLTDMGIVAHGSLGDPNPVRAVADAMAAHRIDEIMLCTLDRALSRWLRADVPTALRRLHGIPITVVTTPPGATQGPVTVDLTQPLSA